MKFNILISVAAIFCNLAFSSLSVAEITCETGVYHASEQSFIILTRSQNGLRFTQQNGERGMLNTPQSPLQCVQGRLENEDDSVWSRLGIEQIDTRFTSGDASLAGRLMLPPEASSTTPLVVFAHGSEPEGWIDVYTYPYQLLARGVSVFVYDKRGTGLSEGQYVQNMPLLADDLVVASHHAKSLAGDRYGRFGLIGVSQGGWVAPLAAQAAEADFIAIGYGLLTDLREEDAAQVAAELRAAGFGEEVLAHAEQITNATARYAQSLALEDLEAVYRLRDMHADTDWLPYAQGDYTGIIVNTPRDEFLSNVLPYFESLDVDWSHDPVAVINTVQTPQLWALAAEDMQAPIEVTLERLNALNAQAQIDLNVAIFPNTDHGMWEFEENSPGQRRFTRITDGYYDLLADWAKGELNTDYGRSDWLIRSP